MPHVRREFPPKVKDAAWERCGGPDAPRCEDCSLPIVGTPVYDHRLPDNLNGEPTLENCQVLCRMCDRLKTAGDQKQIAKMRHQRRANAGIKPRSRGFRRWRKFSGEIVERRD